LSLPGGVANYYNILQLANSENISYFFVNKAKPQSIPGTISRLLVNYVRFIYITISKKYRIIHINPSLDYKSFYRDAIFIIISRILQKKILIFFRGWLEEYEQTIKGNKFKSWLFKISYAKANKYIVLSKLFKKKLLELGVSKNTEFFIETTVADTTYLSGFKLEKKIECYQEKINFLFLSRILKEKGIYIAIDSFEQFLKRFPDKQASLTIAGDGPELTQVKEYVTEKKLSGIIFTGYITGEMKKKVFYQSHVLLLPSYSEGMPNVILEAMLYGMPIISRITGAIPDIIQQNVNGFLTESLRPEIFSEFLSLIATDSNLYKKIAENNFKMASEKFVCQKVKERILKIYATF
jgi:glycosyltransferase involved in cell wall biosynthesis